MATFANTTNPTPFGQFDSDTDFQSEADNMVVFVKRKLGDDVLSVELTKKQIWANFEEAMFEYGSILNMYQAKSQMVNFLGYTTSSDDAQEKLPRENLESNSKITSESGGLSGKKLTSKSNEVIRFIHKNSNGSFPIIGVGGVFSAKDVIEKLKCGASLVQIYTGFIYEGPNIVKKINKELLKNRINY